MNDAPCPAVRFLIPVYNDWDAVGLLLADLARVMQSWGGSCSVLLVDDCSTQPLDRSAFTGDLSMFECIDVLELRRNLGHQRAIGIGLAYEYEHGDADVVVVMDGDGEDAPRDVPRLLAAVEQTGGRCAVFAKRVRRSETVGFQIGYHVYRGLHWVMTGRGVNIGNFSALPRPLLRKVVALSELWNHYAAAYVKSRLPIETIPVDRAPRLRGRSHMNFTNLVAHGLSALSVQGDVIGVRLLVAVSIGIGLTVLGLAMVVGIRLFTDLAIPGWATAAAGNLLAVLIQLLMLAAGFILLILHGRSSLGFMPLRDYGLFVDRCYSIDNVAPPCPAPSEVLSP